MFPRLETRSIAKKTAIVFLLSCTCVLSQLATADWEKADHAVERLAPSKFPQLPLPIRRTLTERGCTIPQVWGENKASNVIRGQFIQKGELDWAVLCSVNRVSSIFVFRGGLRTLFSDLVRRPDSDFLQTVTGDGTIGFSRGLATVGRQVIMTDYKAFGGEKPRPIDHQGIDDAFVGKASRILYFYHGKWLTLQGSD
jgi:hypothetical protein